jgi:hypothetical protein
MRANTDLSVTAVNPVNRLLPEITAVPGVAARMVKGASVEPLSISVREIVSASG